MKRFFCLLLLFGVIPVVWSRGVDAQATQPTLTKPQQDLASQIIQDAIGVAKTATTLNAPPPAESVRKPGEAGPLSALQPKPVISYEGRFTATLPYGFPPMIVSRVDEGGGRAKLSYTSIAPFAECSIITRPFPPGLLTGMKLDAFFADMQQQFAAVEGVTNSSLARVTIKNQFGAIGYALVGGKYARVQAVLSKTRIYAIVMVAADRAYLDTPAVNAFFESFTTLD